MNHEFKEFSNEDPIRRCDVFAMLHSLGGCDAQDEWSKGWDAAINLAVDKLEEIKKIKHKGSRAARLQRGVR